MVYIILYGLAYDRIAPSRHKDMVPACTLGVVPLGHFGDILEWALETKGLAVC